MPGVITLKEVTIIGKAPKPITLKEVVITSPVTQKRDLAFFFSGASIGGALSRFSFQVSVEWEGEELSTHPLPAPDAMGRTQLSGIPLPRTKGTLLVAGLYHDWSSEMQRQYNVSPVVYGRCVYSLAVHGKLLFAISPEIITAGSTSDAAAKATTKSDATTSGTVTGSAAPGGIGATASGTVTLPGDTRTNTQTGTTATNVTSVSALRTEQIAAPK